MQFEVEEDAHPEMYVRAVVAVERRLHPNCAASGAKELDQDGAALLLLRLPGVVEGLAQLSCALACAYELWIQGVVEVTGEHLLPFSWHDVLAA
jgi:hypothetical protein